MRALRVFDYRVDESVRRTVSSKANNSNNDNNVEPQHEDLLHTEVSTTDVRRNGGARPALLESGEGGGGVCGAIDEVSFLLTNIVVVVVVDVTTQLAS